MPKHDFELGDAEFAVLRVLWDFGPQTVRDVMERLHDRGRKVAYTTVLTFLSRLEQKGVVSSDKEDLAYVYRAKVTRERVTDTRVKAMLDELFDGSAAPAVLHLIERSPLSSEDIAKLRKLIDDLDSKK